MLITFLFTAVVEEQIRSCEISEIFAINSLIFFNLGCFSSCVCVCVCVNRTCKYTDFLETLFFFPQVCFWKQWHDPDFFGDRNFGIKLCMICKADELKQNGRLWDFYFHAGNSFVKIIDAVSTWMTYLASH